jgi:hypothetical protein
MKVKFTSIKKIVILLLGIYVLFVAPASAQVYCSPTFANGCSSWKSQSISIGTINWTIGTNSCTTSDYTFMSTNLAAGGTYNMTVVNGNWCGVAVWIDFNMDYNFDAGENLYYIYSPNQTNTYNFTISIPALIPLGIYRMRIISPWGSDGYSITNGNGYGSCGSYQYGNFTDFTINITAPTGINQMSEAGKNPLSINFDRNSQVLTAFIKRNVGDNAVLSLNDISGKVIKSVSVTNNTESFDMSTISKGIYTLSYTSGEDRYNLKIVN